MSDTHGRVRSGVESFCKGDFDLCESKTLSRSESLNVRVLMVYPLTVSVSCKVQYTR